MQNVVKSATRNAAIQMIAIVASCTRETAEKLLADSSDDEVVQFHQDVKDGKKAIQYGKIVEL